MRAAAGLIAVLALGGCERFQQKEPPPTYSSTTLDTARAISGSEPVAKPAVAASAAKTGP